MLNFLTPNNKTTLKSYIALLGLVLAAMMILSSPAYASPQKKHGDPVETTDKAVEENKDTTDKVKSTGETKPMELPRTRKAADDALKPIAGDAKSVMDRAKSCFKQDSGAYKCICKGKKECANLTKSKICEPGTEWENEEGFGGCTKKTE